MADNDRAADLSWTAGRYPLADQTAETERVAAYWRWLDEAAPGLTNITVVVAEAEGGNHWTSLDDPGDADWEALHMRHSIGHSWAKYSAGGDLFSLRSGDNIPQATILVVKGAVVHAREHENARLSDDNQTSLQAFADRMEWTVTPDRLPFDVLDDAAAPNTRIKYLLRSADGGKAFGTLVLDGRLSAQQVDELAEALPGGKMLDPAWIGVEALGAHSTGYDHELMSVRYVHDEPSTGIEASAFLEELTSAMNGGGAPAP